jgi:hypothetical protein
VAQYKTDPPVVRIVLDVEDFPQIEAVSGESSLTLRVQVAAP